MLTAIYRSHYYIERALGNILGLAQLLTFVAAEVGVDVGSLVCHSTYAVIDTDDNVRPMSFRRGRPVRARALRHELEKIHSACLQSRRVT
jgi:hypothetical protein